MSCCELGALHVAKVDALLFQGQYRFHRDDGLHSHPVSARAAFHQYGLWVHGATAGQAFSQGGDRDLYGLLGLKVRHVAIHRHPGHLADDANIRFLLPNVIDRQSSALVLVHAAELDLDTSWAQHQTRRFSRLGRGPFGFLQGHRVAARRPGRRRGLGRICFGALAQARQRLQDKGFLAP